MLQLNFGISTKKELLSGDPLAGLCILEFFLTNAPDRHVSLSPFSPHYTNTCIMTDIYQKWFCWRYTLQVMLIVFLSTLPLFVHMS